MISYPKIAVKRPSVNAIPEALAEHGTYTLIPQWQSPLLPVFCLVTETLLSDFSRSCLMGMEVAKGYFVMGVCHQLILLG